MKWLLTLLFFCSTLYSQGFLYSYIDPCNQTIVRDNYSLETQDGGFYVTYYNKSKFFTFEQLLNGELEAWTEKVFQDFEDLIIFSAIILVSE